MLPWSMLLQPSDIVAWEHVSCAEVHLPSGNAKWHLWTYKQYNEVLLQPQPLLLVRLPGQHMKLLQVAAC